MAQSSTETLRIRPQQPFEFDQSLAFIQGFAPCSGDHITGDGRLTTGGYADDRPFVVRVTEAGPETLDVEIEWLAGRGDEAAVAEWLRGFLSLDDDLTELYETADTDPAFERVVEDLYGYHHVRFTTPFEAACWAALSQRTPMQVARGLKRSLVEACGRIAHVDGREVLLFPTPEMVVANAPAVEAAIDHDRKRKTVLAAAEAFEIEDLSRLGDEPLRERLAAIWGFGDWSSEFIALRGFGRLSGLPRTETRLREAVADLYELNTDEASDSDLDRLSEPYAPREGYWAHYIRIWAFRQQAAD